MANKGVLTGSNLMNEFILNHKKICIATKRGLNSAPHYIWFEHGQAVLSPNEPLTHALHFELTKNVDIAWIGGPNLERLASVTLCSDGMLQIETCDKLKTLSEHFTSYIATS